MKNNHFNTVLVISCITLVLNNIIFTNLYYSSGGPADVTAISIAYGPEDSRGKLELRYPYGFEIGCGDPTGKANTTWVEGTAKSVSGSAVNVEFPLCASGLKPMSVRYCWRADPCTFNKCPIYTSTINTSPPFVMKLE